MTKLLLRLLPSSPTSIILLLFLIRHQLSTSLPVTDATTSSFATTTTSLPNPTNNNNNNPLSSSSSQTFSSSSSNPQNHRQTIVERYYSSPRIKWTRNLGSGTIHDLSSSSDPDDRRVSLRRGNGIVVSLDGNLLFVTGDDGRLHILHAHHIGVFDKIHDPRYDYDDDDDADEGWFTFCQSSVSLFHTVGRIPQVVFAVYAVIDTPPRGSNDIEEERSRIIAVDHRGSLLWSTTLPGVTVGTPLVSKSGKFVYVVHNVRDETVGVFTILDVNNDGSIHSTHRHNGGGSRDNIRPYGPASRTTTTDKSDVLYFGETPDRGYDYMGIIHKVTIDVDGNYASSTLRQTRWSTATAPTISNDGERLWMSGRDAWMRGVTTDLTRSDMMMWKTDLDASLRNRTQPLYNKATLSPDEQYLYVASASTSFYCLDAATGHVIWRKSQSDDHDDPSGIFLTEARVSYDNQKVFTIRHNDGLVTQHSALTGSVDWTHSCQSLSSDPYCQDSVEAAFTLSPDGSTLYYGDIFGTITALIVGRTPEPTDFPSVTPTVSASPSIEPTSGPTRSGMPSERPSASPTGRPTGMPSASPTEGPTGRPSGSPSDVPTVVPSVSMNPSGYPSSSPTTGPTVSSAPTVPLVVAAAEKQVNAGDVLLVGLALTLTVVFSVLCVVLVRRLSGNQRRWRELVVGAQRGRRCYRNDERNGRWEGGEEEVGGGKGNNSVVKAVVVGDGSVDSSLRD